MVRKKYFSAFWLLGAVAFLPSAKAQETKDVETATSSKLANVQLPADVFRLRSGSEPQVFLDLLKAFVEGGGPKVKQGGVEVLAWSGTTYKKSKAPQLQKDFTQRLKNAGWTYEEDKKISQGGQDFIPVSIVRTQPDKRAVIGFWAPADDALLLAWTEMLPKNAPVVNNPPASNNPPITNNPTANDAPTANAPATTTPGGVAAPAGAKSFELTANTRYINVMKGLTPKIPTFPELAPKSGFVRGYVKDWTGKPLANAKLGVRATAVGGAYSGSKGKTDDKGYYEFPVPFGTASFYAGAYTVDWGDEGRAALSLHPADGELDGFASNVGGVENFVLLTYGITNRDKVSDQPQYSGNYYGGTFSLSYSVSDGGALAGDWELPAGSQIEVILTPQGALFDGSKGQSFVLRKRIAGGDVSTFYVNNIPLGTYSISATMDGRPLKLKETGPYRNETFGLEPKETRGTATLTFRPGGAQAETTIPQNGNWQSLNITLER